MLPSVRGSVDVVASRGKDSPSVKGIDQVMGSDWEQCNGAREIDPVNIKALSAPPIEVT